MASTLIYLTGLMAAMSFSWTRNIIKAVGGDMHVCITTLPINLCIVQRGVQPGEGPTPEQLKNGKFRVSFIAKGEPKPDGTVPVLTALVGADREPGYASTARMLVESALCLALDVSLMTSDLIHRLTLSHCHRALNCLKGMDF